MLRALRAKLGSGTPGLRRQLRARRLPDECGRRRARDRCCRASSQATSGRRALCTLEAGLDGDVTTAVNDVVVDELEPRADGRARLGDRRRGARRPALRRDDLLRRRPARPPTTSRTAGPVMMWGLEAMAITFVAPHSLHARPLVVPRGLDLEVANRTVDVRSTVLVDGHAVGRARRRATRSRSPWARRRACWP